MEAENQLQKTEDNLSVFSNVQSFELAQRISKSLSSSDLVPKMYKDNLSNCIIALELANRMGASPLMVMQNLDIIQGKPSFSSKFLISSINSCGRFESIKYRITDLGIIKNVQYTEYGWEGGKKIPKTATFAGPINNIQCVAWTSEKGKSEILESSPITIEMAIKEGWYTKDGSKWKTMPLLMLQYRAAAFWQRVYAPELTMGMITKEEAIDIEYEDVTPVNAKKATKGVNRIYSSTSLTETENVKEIISEPNTDFENQVTQPATTVTSEPGQGNLSL
jgi:hypothetical protein